MSPIGMHALLEQAVRRVRRDALLAIIAAVALVVPVVLLIAWLLGGTGWAQPSAGPLILEVLAIAIAVGIAIYARRRWLANVHEAEIARTAESGLSLPDGSVLGLLELRRRVPSGTSPALFERAQSEIAGRFDGRSPEELSGALGARARKRRFGTVAGLGVAVATVLVLAFASPERSRATWKPLLSPVDNLTPPPLPALVVEPGDASVSRGGTFTVRVRAAGRSLVTLHWRAQGDVPRQLDMPVRADTTRGAIEAIDASLVYWVSAPDGAVSDSFRVEPVDPLLVSELIVTVDYPSYLGRPAERYATDVPPLELPEGARITIAGQGTRPLSSALLRSDASEIALDIDGDHFSGRWTPSASGVYEWMLTDRDGTPAGTVPMPLEITVVPDMVPQVELAYPAADTVLPPELVQAVVADARDDYGLAGAWLVSWRVSSAGRAEPPVELALPLSGDPDRAALRALLDARERGLLPGDTLKLFVRVRDGSPRGQEGVSRTIALRLPGRPEMREHADALADEAAEQSAELARAAAELEQQTRNLERRTAASNARRSSGSGGGQPGESSQMGFDEAEESRRVLEQQEQLLQQAEQMREALEALERSMEMAGLRDAEMQERMQELQELYDKMLTPELREKLEQLRQALAERDPQDVQRALEQLTQQQEQFREQLERSMELMKRAAMEQEMGALAQEARELSTQQEALSDEMRQGQPTEEEKRQQEELRERASKLSELLQKLGQELEQQGETESAEKTGDAAQTSGEAEQEMRDATQSAQQGRSQQAAESGQRAADKLEQVVQGLEQTRSEMSESWEREVQESIERATQDALELAQRQESLKQQMEQAQQGGMQPPQPNPQAGQQQQQGGQQQGGQQQQQGGQQQGGQQQQQQGGQGQQGQGQQQGGREGGGQQGAGGDLNSMRAEQQALQQGLQQLGRNLAEAGERTAAMDRQVSNALSRANLSMQETMQGLQQADQTGRMPTSEAERAVDALNQLAMQLLQQGQQMQQQQGGQGMQQALQDLANLAQQQGALNGQTSALMPMNLGQQAMQRQLQQLAAQQRSIAEKLGGMNQSLGGREELLGDLDALSQEAEQIARDLSGGRLPPEVIERQERLFHRLLDAGRSLEKDETTDERVAERPGQIDPSQVPALDASLLDAATRFRTPTAEELRGLPPAYRRLILEYFERLNRSGGNNR